ncbi:MULTISPECIES: hypothetical protein [Microbacterium]|uniref:hypothetical protein n=1 Tax=Microbacterium TaxID=33882 RepID=UPI0006F808E9|nr:MULTISPECIES: hypothetical protein [unclassified Microbacterium]KQS01641.1 acyl-CoA synthetase [Microbacterium sp. Leaf347]MBN9197587.1 acyl-CoA synthetase [Microbacterium ginsengisoli]MCK9919896.1 acyl-CoA synthetase [Microbacteriaceae bacterium K1510]OJU79476.1 MAG: acyl-CoA synthetase [Microbacterium sp. 71-23]
MPDAPTARAFEVRHLQLARAVFAAIAAAMITFSADHSASVGLSVFSGFAITTALVFLLSAWLVYPRGQRTLPLVLGVLTLVAGMVAGVAVIRSTVLLFVLVIVWALVTGLIEGIAGWRAVRRSARGTAAASDARDGLIVGAITVLLAVGMLFISPQYVLPYYIAEANQSFTLTGTAIGVGVFGGYAAIIAVYLAIAGLSPRRPTAPADALATADPSKDRA